MRQLPWLFRTALIRCVSCLACRDVDPDAGKDYENTAYGNAGDAILGGRLWTWLSIRADWANDGSIDSELRTVVSWQSIN